MLRGHRILDLGAERESPVSADFRPPKRALGWPRGRRRPLDQGGAPAAPCSAGRGGHFHPRNARLPRPGAVFERGARGKLEPAPVRRQLGRQGGGRRRGLLGRGRRRAPLQLADPGRPDRDRRLGLLRGDRGAVRRHRDDVRHLRVRDDGRRDPLGRGRARGLAHGPLRLPLPPRRARPLRARVPLADRIPHPDRARRRARRRGGGGDQPRGRRAQRRRLPRALPRPAQVADQGRAARAPALPAADDPPAAGADVGRGAARVHQEALPRRGRGPAGRQAAPRPAPGDDPARPADGLPRLLLRPEDLRLDRVPEVLRARGLQRADAPRRRAPPRRQSARPRRDRREADRGRRRDRRQRRRRLDARLQPRRGRAQRPDPRARPPRQPDRVHRGRGRDADQALRRRRPAADPRLPLPGPPGDVRRRQHRRQQRGLLPDPEAGARALELARARRRARRARALGRL